MSCIQFVKFTKIPVKQFQGIEYLLKAQLTVVFEDSRRVSKTFVSRLRLNSQIKQSTVRKIKANIKRRLFREILNDTRSNYTANK